MIKSGRLSTTVSEAFIRQIDIVAGTTTVDVFSQPSVPGAGELFMMIVRGSSREAIDDNMAALAETDKKHLWLDSRDCDCDQQWQT